MFLNQCLNDEENSLIKNPPYQLTLPLEELLFPARKNRKNKNKPQGKIPRPQNAWVLFRKDYEANQRMRFPDKALKMKNVSTDAGEVWRKQSTKVKRYFEILSRLAHEQHKKLYPNYKYTPKKKIPKDNDSKDWVFRDGSGKQSNTLTIVNAATSNYTNDDDASGSSTVIQSQQQPSEISPLSSSPPSSPESWNSQTIIHSPVSPSTNFIIPSTTQNDLGLYFSTVTSILTYEETFASSSS